MTLKYEQPAPTSRVDAERALSSSSPEEVCDALLASALHDPDWRWVQEQCLRSLQHPSEDVRGLALTCLGHVARLHGRLDVERVLPALAALRAHPALAGRVEDALDDIEMFLDRPGTEAP
jgi:hypothetical protein